MFPPLKNNIHFYLVGQSRFKSLIYIWLWCVSPNCRSISYLTAFVDKQCLPAIQNWMPKVIGILKS